MTTKEKVIRESIKRNEKRITKLREIIYATPVLDIIQLHIDLREVLNGRPLLEMMKDKEFHAKFKEMADKETELFKLAEKQKNSAKMIDKEVKLTMELSDLNHELYFIERKKR